MGAHISELMVRGLELGKLTFWLRRSASWSCPPRLGRYVFPHADSDRDGY